MKSPLPKSTFGQHLNYAAYGIVIDFDIEKHVFFGIRGLSFFFKGFLIVNLLP